MAITHVGNAEGSAVSGGNVSIDISGLGLQENDYVVVTGCNAVTGVGDITSADYGTAIATDGGGHNPGLKAYGKVMGATPDTTVTWSGGGNAAHATAVTVSAYRGVDTTNPIDATAVVANAGSGSPNSGSINTATAGAVVISAVGSTFQDSTVTAPTGYTGQVDVNGGDTNDATCCMAHKEVASPGAEDPAAWGTFSSGAWHAFTIALRPAGAGGAAGFGGHNPYFSRHIGRIGGGSV